MAHVLAVAEIRLSTALLKFRWDGTSTTLILSYLSRPYLNSGSDLNFAVEVSIYLCIYL